jgi:hypothetical protein
MCCGSCHACGEINQQKIASVRGPAQETCSEHGTDLLKGLCERLSAVLEDHQFVTYLDKLASRCTVQPAKISLEGHEVYSEGYDRELLQ